MSSGHLCSWMQRTSKQKAQKANTLPACQIGQMIWLHCSIVAIVTIVRLEPCPCPCILFHKANTDHKGQLSHLSPPNDWPVPSLANHAATARMPCKVTGRYPASALASELKASSLTPSASPSRPSAETKLA